MTLRTSDLPSGHTITVWWVIFNHPENRTGGMGALRCGGSDLFVAAVQPSVVYAAGNIVGASGMGSWGGALKTGDTRGEIWGGPGLVNPLGADIHLVVHDHGVAPPSMRAAAIHNFGPCFAPVPDCADIQFAAHEQ